MEWNIFVALLVGIFLYATECNACFDHNVTVNLGYLKTSTSFYRECYCEDPAFTTRNLRWLDVNDQEIGPMGPGTQRVYTERTQASHNLHIPSLSKTLSGYYKCVTEQDGKVYGYTVQFDAYDNTLELENSLIILVRSPGRADNELNYCTKINYSSVFNFKLIDPLYFNNTKEKQYLIKGKDSLITCQARGESQPVISWYKENGPEYNVGGELVTELTKGEKYEITEHGVMVKNVTNDDGGMYKCIASVFLTGEEVDRYILAEVITLPTIVDIEVMPSKTVIEGESLSMECNAIGYPVPEYSWKKISEESPNVTWQVEANTIKFDSIQSEDRGIYECTATNFGGVAQKQITVEVLSAPIITEFKNVSAAEGSITQMVCKASGRPRPAIVLVYGGNNDSIENDETIHWTLANTNDHETEFHLVFSKVNKSHTGAYYCNASNEVDIAVEEIYLNVLYKPFFDSDKEIIWAWDEKPVVELNCEHDSQPPARVEWQFQGNINEIPSLEQNDVLKELATKENSTQQNKVLHLNVTKDSQYGIYECTAKNDMGKAQKIFDVRKGNMPPAILNVTILDIKATSATFSIEGPQESGPPLIGFTAEYDEKYNYKITNIHENRTWAILNEYRLDKLRVNTAYAIRFAALNKVGKSIFTELIGFVTPERSVPDPPELDYVSNSTLPRSNGNMLFKLKTPEDNGDPIDYYAIKYCPTETADEMQEECKEYTIAPTTEISLDDLQSNTTYSLEVVAHNSEGNSTPTELLFSVSPFPEIMTEDYLSSNAIIGISIVVVILCILLLDVLLFVTRKQGVIASCCVKKNKKKKIINLFARDKKGLLKDNEAADEALKRPDNGHKDLEYNKSTGKHTAV